MTVSFSKILYSAFIKTGPLIDLGLPTNLPGTDEDREFAR
jgi:hypothetical protein